MANRFASEFRPDWRPGAVHKALVRRYRAMRGSVDIAKKRLKALMKRKVKKDAKKPTLIVTKKDGEYSVHMEVMKEYSNERLHFQYPYDVDKEPILFDVGRSAEENAKIQKRKERIERREQRKKKKFLQSTFKNMCEEICLKTYKQAIGILPSPDPNDPSCPCFPERPDIVSLIDSCSCSESGNLETSGSETDGDDWIVEFTPPCAKYDPEAKRPPNLTSTESQYNYLDFRVKLIGKDGQPVPRYFMGPDGTMVCSDLGGFWGPDGKWLEIGRDGYVGPDGRWVPNTFIGPDGQEYNSEDGTFTDSYGNTFKIGVDGYIDQNGKWVWYPPNPTNTNYDRSDSNNLSPQRPGSIPPSSSVMTCHPTETASRLMLAGILPHGKDLEKMKKRLEELKKLGETEYKLPFKGGVPRFRKGKEILPTKVKSSVTFKDAERNTFQKGGITSVRQNDKITSTTDTGSGRSDGMSGPSGGRGGGGGGAGGRGGGSGGAGGTSGGAGGGHGGAGGASGGAGRGPGGPGGPSGGGTGGHGATGGTSGGSAGGRGGAGGTSGGGTGGHGGTGGTSGSGAGGRGGAGGTSGGGAGGHGGAGSASGGGTGGHGGTSGGGAGGRGGAGGTSGGGTGGHGGTGGTSGGGAGGRGGAAGTSGGGTGGHGGTSGGGAGGQGGAGGASGGGTGGHGGTSGGGAGGRGGAGGTSGGGGRGGAGGSTGIAGSGKQHAGQSANSGKSGTKSIPGGRNTGGGGKFDYRRVSGGKDGKAQKGMSANADFTQYPMNDGECQFSSNREAALAQLKNKKEMQKRKICKIARMFVDDRNVSSYHKDCYGEKSIGACCADRGGLCTELFKTHHSEDSHKSGYGSTGSRGKAGSGGGKSAKPGSSHQASLRSVSPGIQGSLGKQGLAGKQEAKKLGSGDKSRNSSPIRGETKTPGGDAGDEYADYYDEEGDRLTNKKVVVVHRPLSGYHKECYGVRDADADCEDDTVEILNRHKKIRH